MYSKMLTFLDPLAEIRSSSQSSDNSQSDVEQETSTEGLEFSKPMPPKKPKNNVTHEDREDKLFEALTAQFDRSEASSSSSDHPDKLFLLSLVPDFSTIKEEYKLDAKAEIINLIRRYKAMGTSNIAPFTDQYGYNSGSQPNGSSGYSNYQQPQRVEQESTSGPSGYRTYQQTNTIEQASTLGRTQINLDNIDSPSNDSEILTNMYD